MKLLPGRYVPTSGTLHKYPATEQCNLDDSEVEVRVETMRGLRELPAEMKFCQHCYTEHEMGQVAGILARDTTEEGYDPNATEVPPDGANE